MKLKISITTAILLLASLFIIPVQAQGLYNNGNREKLNNNATPSTYSKSASADDGSEGGSGIYYAPGNPNDNNDQGNQEAGNDSPIGGGFLFLSLLSGGYALLKYRNRKEK